jgi:hypothetical protein
MFTTRIASGRSGWVSLLAMGMSLAIVITLGVVHSALGDSQADCPGTRGDLGCWEFVPVPCSNAFCVGMSMWPFEDPLDYPICVDANNEATNYSAKADSSWARCRYGQDGDPLCYETWDICEKVDAYWGNECDEDHFCSFRLLKHCVEWRSNMCTPKS